MLFKGFNFRHNKNIIILPNLDEDKNPMPYVEENQLSYIYFGKVIPQNKSKPMNAIKTKYTWGNSGEFVYAVPIELDGHSLTNMAYGTKKQVYLAYDARCYQAKIK